MSQTSQTNTRPLFPRRSAAVLALVALLGLAISRLWDGFGELLWRSALDLTTRAAHVRAWFGGEEFYGAQSSTYPPASYLLLWPFVGWLPFETVRRLWAVTLSYSLLWVMRWCVRAVGGNSRLDRCVIAALVLAMTATGRALFLGQSMPILLACLTITFTLIAPREGEKMREGEKTGWKREVFAALLMLFALVKPSVSAPFLWLLLWSNARARATIWVILGYAALTLAALWFQKNGVGEISSWAHTVGRNDAEISEGYANLRVWMAGVGLKAWSHPAALGVLGWLGWWTHRYRRAPLWFVVGVVGLVARIWTYHASYDDLLLIFPLIALFRIARDEENQQTRFLLIALVLTLLIPTPWIWDVFYLGAAVQSVCSIVWLGVLVFLLRFSSGTRWRQVEGLGVT